MIAICNIALGEHICMFSGVVFTADEDEDVGHHCMQVGQNLYMGPSGSFDDFVNHSCDPNAGLINFVLVAIRPITAGEQITWDYSTSVGDSWSMDCACGASNCRRVIRKYKTLPVHTRQRYEALGIVPDWLKE